MALLSTARRTPDGRVSGLFEAITVLVDRGQAPAMLAAEFELLAQPAHVRVDRARRHLCAHVPYVFEQRIAADDTPLATEQVGGQIELALRKFDVAAVDRYAAAHQVDMVRRDAEISAGFRIDAASTQHRG